MKFKTLICISLDEAGTFEIREVSKKGLTAANETKKDHGLWKKPAISSRDTGFILEKIGQIFKRVLKK